MFAIYKPHRIHKPKICIRYLHTCTHTQREKNPNISLKVVFKAQGKVVKEEESGNKETQKQAKTSNKMKVSTYLSIIILNINGPHAPTERQSS